MFAVVKGWFGEKVTQVGMWAWLNANAYRRVHNLVLSTQAEGAQAGAERRAHGVTEDLWPDDTRANAIK